MELMLLRFAPRGADLDVALGGDFERNSICHDPSDLVRLFNTFYGHGDFIMDLDHGQVTCFV